MPAIVFPKYPAINELIPDWSAVQFEIFRVRMIGLKELAYKHSLERAEVRGTAPQVLGQTLGVYSAEGSFTTYLREYKAIVKALGDGYLHKHFNITVKSSPKKGSVITTDELIGCCLKAPDKSWSQGPDALIVKVDMSILLLIEDGVKPLAEMLGV